MAGKTLKGALCALSLAVPAAAWGQAGSWALDKPVAPEREFRDRWTVAYGSGWSMPEGVEQPSKDGSVNFQTSVEYKLYSALSIGIDIGYSFGHKLKGRLSGRYKGDVDGDGKPEEINFNSDVKVKVLQITPCVRIGKVFGQTQGGAWKVRHTVVGGIGAYHWTSNAGTLSLFGRTTSGQNFNGRQVAFAGDNSLHFGFNFGTALDFQPFEGFLVGAEVRYHRLMDAVDAINYIIPVGRISFTF